MTTSRLTRTVAAAAIVAALAGGTATSATADQAGKVPAVKPFTTNTIVVQKSIGGIRIGETLASARKHFPAKGCSSGGCTYNGAGYQVFFYADALKSGGPKVVDDITIYAPKSGSSVTRVRTSAGIGIGSTTAAVRKAYPKARRHGNTGPIFIGSGKRNTVLTFFSPDRANKHIGQVTVALQIGH